MPPRVATRSVRLRHPPLAAHKTRMQLLTYPMALAQQGATVPLIQAGSHASGAGQQPPPPPPPPSSPVVFEGDAVHSAAGHDSASGREQAAGQQHLPVPRRWVRDADELCIASIHRSNNINRINSYVATYKFDDPQWRPLLLPEVQVLPKPPSARAVKTEAEERDSSAGPSATPTPLSSSPSSSAAAEMGYDVFIDYNKMTTLELISRHANYALRHIVQKGHAMYLVNYAQHSIVQMRGLVEASYVSCAYGIRGERLRTHITHTGPVDVRDIIEVDPATQRVTFNLKKANVRRGVVAVSTVEGYGTWFQRKPMLWQRTRRIGALQSQMGSYDYQLCHPAEVGRQRSWEVSLLAPHVRLIGAQGGAEAIGLVASSQVAQNEKLYMGQFEAPVLTAIDAVQQLAHRTALHHKLLRPAVTTDADTSPRHAAAPPTTAARQAADAATSAARHDGDGEDGVDRGAGVVHEDPQLQERRRLAGMERLLPVSWVTRTPPPYVPLEADLPFRIQLSRPAVIRADAQGGRRGAAAVAFPTGGAVGSPFVRGVPLSLTEYIIHQGVDHYIFDDAPSARPLKWWNQKSNMPYNGYLYSMRSGLLDYVEAAERIPNPLAPPPQSSSSSSTAGGKARAGVKSARLRRRQRRSARASAVPADAAVSAADRDGQEGGELERRVKRGESSSSNEMDADAVPSLPPPSSASGVDGVSALELHLAAESLPAGAEELSGHDGGDRAEAALDWVAEGNDVATSDRPPLHTLVPPSTQAQRRLQRYAQRRTSRVGPRRGGGDAAAAPAEKETREREGGELPAELEGRAEALLQRQLRLRRLRKRAAKTQSTGAAAAPAKQKKTDDPQTA